MAARERKIAAPVLSYRSVALYREDVELLGPGRWLNDAVVSFEFERLGERFPEGTFVSPCVAYFMLFERDIDDLRSGIRGLSWDRDFVFLPINNNRDISRPAGGSHWSLLVYARRAPTRRRCWHIDSLAGSGNKVVADELARVLLSLGILDKDALGSRGDVVEVPCAQQRNGVDCGVFVLEQCERIARFQAEQSATGGGPVDPAAQGPLHDALLTDVDSRGFRLRIAAEVEALQRRTS